jgi:flagellar biosynthetic protein FlhB
MADKEERTEDPTAKKIQEARDKGNVPNSKDVTAVATLLTASAGLVMLFGFMADHLIFLVKYYFSLLANPELTRDNLINIALITAKEFLLIVIPISLIVAFTGVFASVAQFGWLFNTDAILPKFDKLNFINGIKNLISIHKAVDSIQITVKSFIIFGIAFYFFYRYTKELPTVALFSLHDQLDWMVHKALALVALMLFIIGIFAAIDLFLTKKRYKDSLKMTKQEIKDEHKNSEGDPKIKAKIRQMQFQMVRKRMMASIPQADVVVTNPTHYAVALKYEENKSRAPIVLAKGMDHLALKIKEIARENGVHIVQNPPLARALYAQVEVDQEIPEELFATVAEVLAYVYKMNKK